MTHFLATKPQDVVTVNSTDRVHLRPAAQQDVGFLYSLAADPTIAPRWRHHGVIPAPEQFLESMGHDALAQFVAVGAQSDRMIGHLVLYNMSERNQTAFLAAAVAPYAVGTGLGAESVLCMMAYCFQVYPLRKLYFEVPAYNLTAFASGLSPRRGRTLLEQEGCMRGHVYFDGCHWDMHLLAVYREAMEAYRALLARRSRR